MSLKKIEKHIRELEAIKNYEKVKSERDSILKEVRELQANLSSERKRAEELSQAMKNLESQVEEKTNEIKALRDELKTKEEFIEELGEKRRQLESRINELERLKTLAEGKTLKEAEEAFLKAMENKVEEEAEKLFVQMKLKWEKEDKPKEVLNEAVKWLKHVVEQLSKPEQRLFLKEVADAGLPEKVEGIISSGVEKRIDAEFLRRVEEGSDKKAREKLERLKSIEWPKWYRLHAEPRILELESKAVKNALAMLKGPWNITCDKCGVRFQVELQAGGIEGLLRNGRVMIECKNPDCRDFLGRHKINIPLKDLIATFIKS